MRPEHWLFTIPLRLRSLFRRAQTDQELEDELREHVERKTEEYVAKGTALEEARRPSIYSGRPKTARPSNDSLKFGKFAGVVQARSNLIARQIGKFSNDVFDAFTSGQVSEHEANGNTCPLHTWLATKDFRIAYDVVLPPDWRESMVTPSCAKGKVGKSRERIENRG